jgi:hypothetical protein
MRALAIVAALGGAAAAEPRGSYGLRTTWNPQRSPPHWLFTGGQWGVRLTGATWLVLDADGFRGTEHEHHDMFLLASSRSLMTFSLGPRTDLVEHAGNALCVRAGAGLAVELSHARVLGKWLSDDTAWRPLVFGAAAFEHRFGRRGALALELRAVRLFGSDAGSMAPPLDRTSAQLTLEMTGYL